MKDLDDTKAPLLDHLIELRTRLLWCVFALVASFFVCFYFAKDILAILVQPLREAGQDRMIYNIIEAFFAQVKVAFWAAVMISFPILAIQLWRFVAPGLYKNEKSAFLPFLLMTPVLFALGTSLAYFVAMPIALHFLLSFQGDVGGIQQTSLPNVEQYLNFAMRVIFGFGVAFLLPVALLLLERAGIVTRKQLVGGRRYAIVASAVIAAVLTPADVVSMLTMLVPLVLLYEVALIAIWFTERKRSKVLAAEEAKSAAE